MLRRTLLLAALAATAATAPALARIQAKPAPPAQAQQRPNIVVILVDDMGFSDFGSYGGEIPTPNIDALAKDGLRFTQFYNSARCSPTRASLLTGLNPHQAGMGYLSGLRLPKSRGTFGRIHERAVTIPQLLRGAGYYTAMAGKWHLGNTPGSTPVTRGFDRSLSAVAGGIYFPDQATRREGGTKTLFVDGRPIRTDDPMLGKDWYGTDLWTQWGMKFADEAQAKKKPFFLYLAHVAPHFPLMAPEADIARFRGKYMVGWDRLRRERFARQQAMGLIGPNQGLTERPASATAWDSLSTAERERFDTMMAIYAATIARVDKSVGDLVAHLRARKMLDNTLILILSDNGGNAESGPRGRTGPAPWGGPQSNVFVDMNWATLQNTPFRSFKHFTAEGGIATPLIAHWPRGIAPAVRGGFDRTPGHLIDVMPTLIELSGARYPARFGGHDILPMEGVSLAPAFTGASISRPQPLFWEHEGNKAVREGRWKAVQRLAGAWELYDMAVDRTELHDLAGREPARLKAMVAAWDAWAARTYVDRWHETDGRTDWGAPIGVED